MIFIQTLICILLAYICLYALISRFWKCIEHCASAKGYTKLEEAKILAKDQSKGE